MSVWKRVLFRTIVALLLSAGLTYAGDYISLQVNIPPGRQKYGSVQVQPFYIIHQKNGKIEYEYSPPEDDTCVNSLLPHLGFPPCWYLKRHPEKKVEV